MSQDVERMKGWVSGAWRTRGLSLDPTNSSEGLQANDIMGTSRVAILHRMHKAAERLESWVALYPEASEKLLQTMEDRSRELQALAMTGGLGQRSLAEKVRKAADDKQVWDVLLNNYFTQADLATRLGKLLEHARSHPPDTLCGSIGAAIEGMFARLGVRIALIAIDKSFLIQLRENGLLDLNAFIVTENAQTTRTDDDRVVKVERPAIVVVDERGVVVRSVVRGIVSIAGSLPART